MDRNPATTAEECLAPLPSLFDAALVETTPPATDDETFVTDDRAGMSPAQHVERRLVALLKSSPIYVSHVQRVVKPNPR